MGQYIVSLDIGTSSVRAAAFTQGGPTCVKALPLLPHRQKAGCSEYEIGELLSAARTVLHQVLDEVGPAQVKALGISSQRSTIVLWDKNTGQVLGPILTWEDGRALEQAQQATISQEELHIFTGLYKTPYFSAPKITWMLTHLPQVRAAEKSGSLCAAPVTSFLIWKLTGGVVFSTDITLAQRTLLLDIQTGQWSDRLCNAFSISPSILPSLKASVDDYGTYSYKGVSIPIRACVADQQAASSALKEGQMCINYGTGAFVLQHMGTQGTVLPGMLTSLAPSCPGGSLQYLLEGPVNAAGSAFLWLNTRGIKIDMNRLDDICKESLHPLRILPAIGGLGAPYWNFTLSPVILGENAQTTRGDWAVGLVQGICFLIADIVQYMRSHQVTIQGPIKVMGGLSKSDYLVQFQSDTLQQTLLRRQEVEATLLGVARLLGYETLQNEITSFQPKISSEKAGKLYWQWQQFVADNIK
ncbi:MAG: hypothetical protein J5601_01605 [Elusimicrobiaceae bacterium]|nr:hypothetical protein [Elusimicrobiaceae bacterium]